MVHAKNVILSPEELRTRAAGESSPDSLKNLLTKAEKELNNGDENYKDTVDFIKKRIEKRNLEIAKRKEQKVQN